MTRRRAIVIHPSDEMYGADRVLLEVLRTVPRDLDLEVWLPTDIDYPERELSRALEERRVVVRHLPLPIMRRAYLRPTRLVGLAMRALSTGARLIAARPSLVYVNTAAAALTAPPARLSGARVVLHLHEHIDSRSRSVLPFLRYAHHIIAVSSAVAKALPSHLRDGPPSSTTGSTPNRRSSSPPSRMASAW